MPEPKSISELPSASSSTPPPAAVTNTGSVADTPRATAPAAPGEQFARGRAGDLGDEVAVLRQAGAACG